MKKAQFVFLLLLATVKCYGFGPQKSNLQDTTKANLPVKRTITTWVNVGQYFRNEVQVSVEKFISPETALELTVGYKFAEHKNQPFTVNLSSMLILDTFDYAERMPFSEGILIGLGLKGYLLSEKHPWFKTYLSPSVFYRNRFYDQQYISSATLQPDKRYAGNSLQSLDLKIYGAKFLFGHTFDMVVFNRQKKILLDLHYGIDFRHKEAKTSYFKYNGTEFGQYPAKPIGDPQIEKAESDWVSFHAGLRLGFQF